MYITENIIFKAVILIIIKGRELMNQKISAYEKFAYSMGAFGQNFAYGIMASYLMIFYTDSVGIGAGIIGSLFLVARIWDAVIDPFIGVIIDRANLRYGKFRPFILVGGILAGIMTILCFFNPSTGMTGKIIYAYLTYIIWGTTYGIMDVPYWSMAPSMTIDPNERTKIVAIPKITATIGGLLVAVLTIPMVQAFGRGDNSKGYLLTAVIFGALCALGGIIAGTQTRERTKVLPKKKERFIESVNVAAKNKPLLLILLANLFCNTVVTMKQQDVTYYFTYNAHNVDLVSMFMLAGLVPMVLAMVLVPSISKKYGKKNTIIASALLCGVTSALMYYCGGTLPLYFTLNALSMAGLGGINVLTLSMQSDTVEYAEWKTGKRSESIIFSLGTFTTKLSSAVGGALIGYVLTLVGYKAHVEQTPLALGGISMLMSWAPTIGMAVLIVIISFYRFTEQDHEKIVAELEARNRETAQN